MTTDTIPLEAGIEDRAISFTKGCYVGQEVIIRVMHRGHGRVARRLVRLVLQEGAAAFTGRQGIVREINRSEKSRALSNHRRPGRRSQWRMCIATIQALVPS